MPCVMSMMVKSGLEEDSVQAGWRKIVVRGHCEMISTYSREISGKGSY